MVQWSVEELSVKTNLRSLTVDATRASVVKQSEPRTLTVELELEFDTQPN
jgi:hypothetical protein